MLRATKVGFRTVVEGVERIYFCFWQKEYVNGQMLTVASNPGEGPVRCQLVKLYKETRHPANDSGHELTEQWWDFRYIPESEYHRYTQHRAKVKKMGDNQQSLF